MSATWYSIELTRCCSYCVGISIQAHPKAVCNWIVFGVACGNLIKFVKYHLLNGGLIWWEHKGFKWSVGRKQVTHRERSVALSCWNKSSSLRNMTNIKGCKWLDPHEACLNDLENLFIWLGNIVHIFHSPMSILSSSDWA